MSHLVSPSLGLLRVLLPLPHLVQWSQSPSEVHNLVSMPPRQMTVPQRLPLRLVAVLQLLPRQRLGQLDLRCNLEIFWLQRPCSLSPDPVKAMSESLGCCRLGCCRHSPEGCLDCPDPRPVLDWSCPLRRLGRSELELPCCLQLLWVEVYSVLEGLPPQVQLEAWQLLRLLRQSSHLFPEGVHVKPQHRILLHHCLHLLVGHLL